MIADARTSPTWRRCVHTTIEGRCTSCGARANDARPYVGGSDGTIGRGGVPVGRMVPVVTRETPAPAPRTPSPEPATCRRGHAGPWVRDTRGARVCRECQRESNRAWARRRRERVA